MGILDFFTNDSSSKYKKLCKSYLNILENELKEELFIKHPIDDICDERWLDEIISKAETYFDKSKEQMIINVMKEQNIGYEQVVYNTLMGCCAEEIRFGNHYIWRGVQTPQGKLYTRSYIYMTKQMLAKGWLSEEEAKEELAALKEEIQTNG